MSQYDPDLDPQTPTPAPQPVYTETVVIRPESNTGWWVAGGLAAVVLSAVIWLLVSNREPDAETTARLAEAEAQQAQADAANIAAQVQSQIAGAQAGVAIARADAVRAQAEAVRAAADARAAEARAATPPPVVVQVPQTAPAPNSTPPQT